MELILPNCFIIIYNSIKNKLTLKFITNFGKMLVLCTIFLVKRVTLPFNMRLPLSIYFELKYTNSNELVYWYIRTLFVYALSFKKKGDGMKKYFFTHHTQFFLLSPTPTSIFAHIYWNFFTPPPKLIFIIWLVNTCAVILVLHLILLSINVN